MSVAWWGVGRGMNDPMTPDVTAVGGGEGPQLVEPVERIGELALGSDERDEHGDPEGAADLTGGLVDGAAHGEACGWERRHRAGAQDGEREADAEPDEQRAGEPGRRVVRGRRDQCDVAWPGRWRSTMRRTGAPVGTRRDPPTCRLDRR